jgi:hydrogenase maturation protein HypF
MVRGIVQGVGFRPFIFSLAHRYALAGSVHNDVEGVRIEAEGPPEALEAFLRDINLEAPPLAVVDAVTWQRVPARGDGEFLILESQDGAQRQALVAPDVATCSECLAELFDPSDRRYRYPFINCTNCGPRFTITRSVPYDRAVTTMAGFKMCTACQEEYDDPADRRFHAQPNACPSCGPAVRLLDHFGCRVRSGALGTGSSSCDAIAEAAELLRHGAIVAIKGLGGYHLACDPGNEQVVDALRRRKARQDRPFALMARDLEQARALCDIAPDEEALLAAPARPIVLLDRRADGWQDITCIAELVAPRQKTLGIMLAYTPVHYLLLHDTGTPLVMTSGNHSDEPIAYQDGQARERLGHIADYFLVHNRTIHVRCDDSVVRRSGVEPPRANRVRAIRVPSGCRPHGMTSMGYPIRRSRGYVPAPVLVAKPFRRRTLACGGELKNTFCLAKERYAFISHHNGDLENFETFRSFRDGVEHYSRLFDIQPELLAYDLHPEYLSTKYARDREEDGIPAVGVQHHHAHIASCLADNLCPVSESVIGVALDGTGYGADGTIWGGELFEGSVQAGFVRRMHLAYVPLPGGPAAIREPWRMAIAYLLTLRSVEEILGLPLGFIQRVGEQKIRVLEQMIRTELNAPPTSSAGRLFDAVAALLGVPGSLESTYEGQAAVELELIARDTVGHAYPFQLREEQEGWVVETRETIGGLLADRLLGLPAGEISARFHRTVAEIVVAGCETIRRHGGPQSVALSGGTFQNMRLLRQVVPLLKESGFRVYLHRRVPTNDGGLSLGQAVLADMAFQRQDG